MMRTFVEESRERVAAGICVKYISDGVALERVYDHYEDEDEIPSMIMADPEAETKQLIDIINAPSDIFQQLPFVLAPENYYRYTPITLCDLADLETRVFGSEIYGSKQVQTLGISNFIETLQKIYPNEIGDYVIACGDVEAAEELLGFEALRSVTPPEYCGIRLVADHSLPENLFELRLKKSAAHPVPLLTDNFMQLYGSATLTGDELRSLITKIEYPKTIRGRLAWLRDSVRNLWWDFEEAVFEAWIEIKFRARRLLNKIRRDR